MRFVAILIVLLIKCKLCINESPKNIYLVLNFVTQNKESGFFFLFLTLELIGGTGGMLTAYKNC